MKKKIIYCSWPLLLSTFATQGEKKQLFTAYVESDSTVYMNGGSFFFYISWIRFGLKINIFNRVQSDKIK